MYPVVQQKSSCRHHSSTKIATFVSWLTEHVAVYLVRSKWKDDADGLTKWSLFRDGLLNVNNTMLGFNRRHQPDWFTEAEDVLRPLIDKSFLLWLEKANCI